jgi:farnesyl diphosphate synthase
MLPEASARPNLEAGFAATAREVERELDILLPAAVGPEAKLYEAMRYACLGGGKRLRPLLVIEGAKLFAVQRGCALRVAAAIEMVHCYSLVHDDLPAMDDSALRRGRPTAHIAYDEATAILAGDALLTLSFEVLADPKTHGDATVRAELVRELAVAAGPAGMCGGQMLDLVAEHQTFDLGEITRLQRLKTGALFTFSCIAGAVLGKASMPLRMALAAYAHDLGLAFQIADDLLDAEGDQATVGKDVGKDAGAGKATFVSILGLDRARAQARLLADQAAAHLEPFGEPAELLRAIARFVVDRKS